MKHNRIIFGNNLKINQRFEMNDACNLLFSIIFLNFGNWNVNSVFYYNYYKDSQTNENKNVLALF